MPADRNTSFGLAIATLGLVLGLGAYTLIGSIPLTAMGIGLIIIGASWALTPPHPIPRKAVLDIIESSCSNIEALLEFVGAARKAIYIPSEAYGRVVAYVPLRIPEDGLQLRVIAENPGRVIVRQGGSLGVIVNPPSVEFGGGNPGIEDSENIEALLDYALVEASEIAESIKTVRSEEGFIIEIYKVRVDVEYQRFRIVMGSLPSCLAAQVVAAALSKPIQIADEKRIGDKLTVYLKPFEWTETIYT